MNKKTRSIIFWVLYLLLEINLEFAWSKYDFPILHWIQRLVNSILTETLFLIVKIPFAYYVLRLINFNIRHSYRLFFFIIGYLISILFHRLLVHDLFWPHIFEEPEKITRFYFTGLFNGMMDLMFLLGVFIGFEFFFEKLDIKRKFQQVTQEKLSTELQLLKSQINPHFLFNTLNNIYGLSLKKSDDAPEVIMKLSKIMRYSIFESAKEFVSIEDEIENIKDYIEIQRIRYKDLVVQFESNIDDFSKEISPLILLQFIENAFKYGTSETTEKPLIVIKVLLIKGIFHFEVTNSKGELPQTNSTKIGLKNLERQLDLLYKDRYELIVDNLDTIFTVKLTIFLNNE